MKAHIFLFCTLFFLTFHSPANPVDHGEIKGIITDKLTKQPIEYANIVLFQSSDSSMLTGTISSEEGLFILSSIQRGNYYLKVDFLGYDQQIISPIQMSLKKQEINLETIELSPKSILLEEAEVVSNTDYISFKIDKKIVHVSEQVNAEGGPVVDALVNVPSVQVDGSGNVTLRGSSSFTLLIDGRPSILTASDALNQIQASSVEKIEIITNPSAKYQAEGSSGIINLIMKKQKKEGLDGLVNISLATGDKYAAKLLLSKRSSKWTSRLGGLYSNKRKRTESLDERDSYNGDTILSQYTSSDRDIFRRNYQLDGGLVYDANERNSISLNAKIGQWEFDRRIDSDIQNSSNYDSSQFFLRTEKFLIKNQYLSGDMAYQHDFNQEGHELDISIYYSHIKNETPNHIEQIEKNSMGQYLPNELQNYQVQSNANRNDLEFKTDYTLSLGGQTILECGFLNDYKSSITDYLYQSKPVGSGWQSNSDYSGQIDYKRWVNSMYTSISSEIFKIQVKAGFRVETSSQKINQKDQQKQYDEQNIHIFPSLHLSKSLEKNQQIALSYSQRINRPNEWMLLPSPYSTGRNMLYIGNPELIADITHSFEFSYQLQKQNILLSTDLYFRNSQNSITTTTTEMNGEFFLTYENLQYEIASGIELMSQINIKPWWKMNIGANAYYYKLKGLLKSDYLVDQIGFGWNGNFRTTFILKKKTYFEFMAIYYGPSILAQGKSKDFYYFDFFLRRNFFNRKLSVALRTHNTFDTGIYIEDIEGPHFKSHTWFKYEGPTFMISLTYKINHLKRSTSSNQPDMNFDSGLDH